jgi:hypothetical protein
MGWLLVWSSLAAGISIFVISTFSSSVFAAKEVLSRQTVPLQRYTAAQGTANTQLPINLKPQCDTYFQTISVFLFNVSTFTWMSDSYVVVPFEPVTNDTGRHELHDDIWKAETEVFQLEARYLQMVMTENTLRNIIHNYADTENTECKNDTCVVKSKGFKLRSEDGCKVQIQSPVDVWSGLISTTPEGFRCSTMNDSGGIIWTNMSSSYVSWQDLIHEYGQTAPLRSSGDRALEQWTRTFTYSMSDECFGRDLLLASPPWIVPNGDASIPSTVWERDSFAHLTVRAEVCTPNYLKASMRVTASVGGAKSTVSVDTSEFALRRKPVPKSMLGYDQLNDPTISNDWNKFMVVPRNQWTDIPVDGSEGALMLHAQHFSQNLSDILQNDTLRYEASRYRTRIASQLLLSSPMDANAPAPGSIMGEFTRVQRQVLLITQVSIALPVLLFLPGLLLFCFALVRINQHAATPSQTALCHYC